MITKQEKVNLITALLEAFFARNKVRWSFVVGAVIRVLLYACCFMAIGAIITGYMFLATK